MQQSFLRNMIATYETNSLEKQSAFIPDVVHSPPSPFHSKIVCQRLKGASINYVEKQGEGEFCQMSMVLNKLGNLSMKGEWGQKPSKSCQRCL